jgi:long-chain fatty acid transport protein
VAVGLAALCVPTRAGASPEEIFGYGPRQPAFAGGAGAASAKGFEAAVTNPALLSLTRQPGFTLGLQGASFSLAAAGAGLPGKISYESATGVVIGIDVPLPFKGALTDRVGIGAAFYTPTDIIVRGRILYPEKPQFVLLPERAQSLTARAGVGVDLGYGIRVGSGFATLAEIVGDVVVATDATGKVGTRVEDQLVATFAPTFGVTYDLPVKLLREYTVRAGLSYRGRLDARFAVSIDGTRLSSLQIPIFNIAGLAQFDPAQVALEIAALSPSTMVMLGLTYKKWSGYPGPLEPSIFCPADNPGCGIQPPKIAYDDLLVPSVGAEHAILDRPTLALRVRAGLRVEGSPLPSRLPASEAFDEATKQSVTVPTRYFDSPRFIHGWGAGVALKRPLIPVTIDVWGQHQHLVGATITSVASDGTVLSEGEATGSILGGGLLMGVGF